MTIREKVEGIIRRSDLADRAFDEIKNDHFADEKPIEVWEGIIKEVADKILSLLPSIEEMAEVIEDYIVENSGHCIAAEVGPKALASALSEKWGKEKDEILR